MWLSRLLNSGDRASSRRCFFGADRPADRPAVRRALSLCTWIARTWLRPTLALQLTTVRRRRRHGHRCSFEIPVSGALQIASVALETRRMKFLCKSPGVDSAQQQRTAYCWRVHTDTVYHKTVTVKTESSKDGAIALSRMNFSGYVRYVTLSSSMLTTVCCFNSIRLGFG